MEQYSFCNRYYIYFLGDFSLGKFDETVEVLEQLNGNIIFIKGNHDSTTKIWNKVVNMGILHELHEVGCRIKHKKQEIWLSHFPMEIGHRPNKWNISGHIHDQESKFFNQINVGVDSPHFNKEVFGTPISINEIYKEMQKRAPEIERLFLESRS